MLWEIIRAGAIFVWAAIGILSRVAMAVKKEKWAYWEEGCAYKEKRPVWVVLVAVFGLMMIIAVWLVYILTSVPYGWVLAVLITLTAIKIITLLVNYDKFRTFLKRRWPIEKGCSA